MPAFFAGMTGLREAQSKFMMPTPHTAHPEVVLRLDGITKRFGTLVANDDIGFEVRRGEIVALLGENGAGKTTLMNILFGHYVADEGSVEVSGRPLPPGSPRAAITAGIGMVHQHFTLADNLTALDNIVLGTEPLWKLSSNRGAARQRVGELSAGFGLAVDPDRRVGTLSVGEQQRVEVLKALYRRASILILDEPTAVLTPGECEALFATLKKLVARGLSIIFISHKLAEVMAVSDRVLVLRAGRLVAERRAGETSREELAELMIGRQIGEPKVEPQRQGDLCFELDHVSVYDESGKKRLDDVSLKLHESEIVGIAGVAGNGQTALADFVANMRGLLGMGCAYIPEDRLGQGVVADMSVTENAISERYRDPDFCRWGFLNWSAARKFAQHIITAYGVKCTGPAAPIRELSGGNIQKLILGRELSQSPRLIVANQPTRGLDVGAVSYVHGELLQARQRGAAILLISEDLDELLAICDRIAVMYRGRLSDALPRRGITAGQLGLMMAGHGFYISDGEAHAA